MSVENFVQYVIVGAGPAGLQLAHYLKQRGRNFTVLESQGHPGAFFDRYPRHRKLISINKVYSGYDDGEINLRWDWNSLLDESDKPVLFKQFSKRYFPNAAVMVEYLQAYAEKHEIPVRYNSAIKNISRDGDFYRLEGDGLNLICQVLLIATGVAREHVPDIPGIELCEGYGEVSVNPEDFVGQRVLVIGKGNSAFETADNLVETASMIHVASPNPLKMAWSTHYVGHLRAVNNNLLDTYQLKSQNAVIDGRVLAIRRVGEKFEVTFSYAHAQGEVEAIYYDRVIRCTGFAFDARIFSPECDIATCMDGRFPDQTAEWESTNRKNVFFIGTLMQSRDFKKYMSGFVHGFRYNIRTLHHLLEERFHGVPYPDMEIEHAPESLAWAILTRINRSSGLWQQPGFLCDVVLLDRSRETARYLNEMSFDIAQSRYPESEFLTVSLEFGARKFADPFAVERVARDNYREANESNFLHPVIRHFSHGKKRSEHHIIEDLAAEWVEPEHIEPLHRYLMELMASDFALDREPA